MIIKIVNFNSNIGHFLHEELQYVIDIIFKNNDTLISIYIPEYVKNNNEYVISYYRSMRRLTYADVC